jgi:excisionase family DNA binding protein
MAATYTVKQVAQILGYSTNSIYTFLKAKRIKGVRVGQGRFRIPQSELDRLLLFEKGKYFVSQAVPGVYQQLQTPVLQSSQSGIVEPPVDSVFTSVYPAASPRSRVDVPSLFDWFVGIGSIILGLAMFLFSKTHEEYAIEPFIAWMPGIRMTLIAGGFGLLLADIVGRRFSSWHRVFHGALILAYGTYAFILGQIGNLDGIVIFGSLTGIMLVTFFVAIGGIAGFALYVILLLVLLPAAALISPVSSSFYSIMSNVPVPMSAIVFFWLCLVGVIAGVLWFGYQKDRRAFWIGMLAVSTALIGLAVHFAENLWWGRALFILVTALLAVFIPVWQTLTFSHKRDRAFIFTAFGSLLVLYILVVGVLRVMQTNILDYASRELANKVSYGKSLIESTIISAKTSLTSTAANQLLVTSVQKGDTETLTQLAKAVFEGNFTIRRIIITTATGETLTRYPYEIQDATTYQMRDYFIRALTTKKPVTSDLFEATLDSSRRKTVVIAVPILDSKQVVVGMLLGSMDLDILGNKLQQIASSKTGEYFVVVDRSGKRIIHPDAAQIGTEADENDPVRLAFTGRRGVEEGYSLDGIRSLVAFDMINDETGWAIAVKAPVTEILKATNAADITVFSVVLISIVMVGMFLLSHRVKTVVPEITGDRGQRIDDHGTRIGEVIHTRVHAGKGKPGQDTS